MRCLRLAAGPSTRSGTMSRSVHSFVPVGTVLPNNPRITDALRERPLYYSAQFPAPRRYVGQLSASRRGRAAARERAFMATAGFERRLVSLVMGDYPALTATPRPLDSSRQPWHAPHPRSPRTTQNAKPYIAAEGKRISESALTPL